MGGDNEGHAEYGMLGVEGMRDTWSTGVWGMEGEEILCPGKVTGRVMVLGIGRGRGQR